ncbi:cation diffusion facilitator family transporter [Salinisphaera sp. S4-8]|uniref:cation transporter n=1 Tax=Salinisphaera sp. S4-8 TaxID=633357 RepID=UPI00334061FD
MTEHAPRDPNRLPAAKQRALARARRVEWLTLMLRITAVGALYLALGTTQSLTAIWLKSLWALLPPVAFLVACRVERLPPRPRFPYGFYRAGTIAFLSGALALSAMGLFLLYVGLRGLIELKHPALQSWWQTPIWHWAGWPVLAALAYSMLVPVIAGRSRQRLAIDLHDKGLYADATMGRASWLAGGAAIVGVLGIGLGLWWADFVATLIIGADILRHGLRHLHTAVCDLIDEVPRKLGTSEVDPLSQQLRDHLEALDWVAEARVRLREEGRRLTGIAFVCPHPQTHDVLERFERARRDIESLDWRLLDFELVPVSAERCANAIRTAH